MNKNSSHSKLGTFGVFGSPKKVKGKIVRGKIVKGKKV